MSAKGEEPRPARSKSEARAKSAPRRDGVAGEGDDATIAIGLRRPVQRNLAARDEIFQRRALLRFCRQARRAVLDAGKPHLAPILQAKGSSIDHRGDAAFAQALSHARGLARVQRCDAQCEQRGRHDRKRARPVRNDRRHSNCHPRARNARLTLREADRVGHHAFGSLAARASRCTSARFSKFVKPCGNL